MSSSPLRQFPSTWLRANDQNGRNQTGWGFFFCGAAALALIARLELACAQTFNASMAAALWARNTCMAAASATHLACINTAIATRDACINNAEQILIQQIVACPANP